MRQVAIGKLLSLASEGCVPWRVTWDLTYACQLRCRHCYLMNTPVRRGSELSTTRVIRVLDELCKLGTQEVVFSGGDPLVRSDLLQVVRHAGNSGLQVVVFSSGMAIDEDMACALRDARVCRVELTLLGADAATHDAITRCPGSFARVLAAVRSLRALAVPVVAKTVVMQQNVEQLDQLIAMFQDMRLEYRFDPHVWLPWCGSEDQVAPMRLNRANMREFYARYRRPKPQPVADWKGIPCTAGRTTVAISPYGEVTPCLAFGPAMIAGDLHRQGFAEIWQASPVFAQMRTATMQDFPKCQACHARAFCDWCPGLSLWAGKELAEPYSELCIDTEIKAEVWETTSRGA